MEQKKLNEGIVIIIFIFIFLLGFNLRVFNLTKQDYWLDEGFAMITAEQSNLHEVTDSVFLLETAPPLYFYLLHFWVQIFSNSILSTRALSVLFGILSIPLIFLAARKLSDYRTALLAAAIFSVSMINIWISQEVRPYSLFVFLTLLSTFFLIKIFSNDKKFSNYLLYFISLIFLVYTSYFSIFVLFFHFMTPLFIKKYKVFKKTFPIQFIAGLSLLPWLIKSFSSYEWKQDIVYEILFYHAGLPKFIAKLGQFALISPLIILSLVVIISYLINLKHQIRMSKNYYNIIFLLTAASMIIYFFILINFDNQTVNKLFTWSRYFIFLFPVLHFIIAKTFFNVSKKFKIILAIFIILLSFLALYQYYSSTLKEEWTPAMSFIEQTRSASDGIILVDEGGANIYLINYYYEGPMEVIELAWKDKELSLAEIETTVQDKSYAWLVLSRNWKRQDYYKNMLDDRYNPILQKEFKGIDLYLYDVLES